MGTSVNQASPNSPPWRPARAVLGNPAFAAKHQSAELWRAALGDRGNALLSADLGHPAIATACRIAGKAESPVVAIRAWDEHLAHTRAAGLTLDLARRALIRATLARRGATGFAGEVFAEMVSYYASRDLPSFVGARFRLTTPTQAVRLKDDLRAIARQASHVKAPAAAPGKWRTYVKAVVKALTKGVDR